MNARLLLAPPTPGRELALALSLGLFAITLGILLLGRATARPASPRRALIYRFGVLASVVLSYFELATLLPALSPKLLDVQLYQIDRFLFGETPAKLLAHFATPSVVEWFAFFYFSYFVVLGTVLLPSIFLRGDPTAARLQLGAVVVASLGHIVYTFVPGIGPHVALTFATQLDGGFWWHSVLGAVGGGGAQLDIFPSLHTAYPSFFALFSFRHRQHAGYRYAWPLLAFVAVNIIVSTMLLRWHYGIDVIFGLLLAYTAERVSRRA